MLVVSLLGLLLRKLQTGRFKKALLFRAMNCGSKLFGSTHVEAHGKSPFSDEIDKNKTTDFLP